MHPKTFISVSAALLLAAFVGCSSNSQSPQNDAATAESVEVTLVNSVCPMMGGPVDKAVTVEWNGKTVGFCCADCIPGWNKLSEEEKVAKLASADKQPAADHDNMHKATSPVAE